MHAAVQRLIDKEAIREVLYAYCRACDRQDIAAMRRCFAEEATVQMGYYNGPAEGFCDRFSALGDPATSPISRLQHRVLNTLFHFDDNGADVESYFNVCRRRLIGDDFSVDEILASRVLDRFERRGDQWCIVRRSVIWDWMTALPAQAAFWETDPGDYLVGARDGSDPSWDLFPYAGTPG